MKVFRFLSFCFIPIIFVSLTSNAASAVSETKITASDGAAGNYFGWSVSINGETLVVGTNSESAYVFRHNGTTWVEEAKLTASGGGVDIKFGYRVSISGDIIVVGAWADDDLGTDSGSAYVFRHNGSTWVEEAKLTASDGEAEDRFGHWVSISEDIIVVGAHLDDDLGTNSGSAYVYRHNGTSWVEEAKLTANDGAAGDIFGFTVSISGETVLVGGPYNNWVQGSAYVFRHNGTTWVEEAKLTASDGATNDYFGWSVSINGETLVVGTHSKSAYVFRYNGSTWVEEAKLTSDGNETFFGWSVSISGDNVLVGARQAGGGSAAYMFKYNGTSWVEDAILTPSEEAHGFGDPVSISGNVALVGAPANTSFEGSAFVFDFRITEPVPDIKVNGSDGPITITTADILSVEIELDPGNYSGYPADWWVLANSPFGWFNYHLSSGWLPGRSVTHQGSIFELNPFEVMNKTLPQGGYTFYFGVDGNMNGAIDMGQMYYDSVDVNVTP